MIKGKNGAKFKGPSDTKRRLQSADEVKGTQKPQQPAAGTPAAAIEQNAKPIPPTSSYNPPQDPNKTYGKVMVSGNTWAQNFADKNGQNGDVRTGYITPQAAPGNDVGNNAEEAVTAQQTGVQAPAAPADTKTVAPAGNALATSLTGGLPKFKSPGLQGPISTTEWTKIANAKMNPVISFKKADGSIFQFQNTGKSFVGADKNYATREEALDSRMNARVAEARNELKQVAIMGPRWQRYGETNSFDPYSILRNAGQGVGRDPRDEHRNQVFFPNQQANAGEQNAVPGVVPLTKKKALEGQSLAGGGTTGITVGNYQDPFGS